MSELDEVQAAIRKLEELRVEAYGDTLVRHDTVLVAVDAVKAGYPVLEVHPDSMRSDTGQVDSGTEALLELVAALYGSVEALQAILRNYTEVYGVVHTPRGFRQSILKLARKINGGTE